VGFHGRPPGLTLRRAREAEHNPHGSSTERFDADFPTAMRCGDCGKFCYGPRKYMSESMREHRESHCPARRTRIDDPHVMQVLYPRI
jgi:hypothetical protein